MGNFIWEKINFRHSTNFHIFFNKKLILVARLLYMDGSRAGNMGWPVGYGLACPNPRVRWAGSERPVLNGLKFGQP